jgi:hypothetical protein
MQTTNFIQAPRPASASYHYATMGALLLLAAALATGCSHTKRQSRGTAIEIQPTPLPPLFLNGPMALLLTNSGGFRAHVVLNSGTSAEAKPLAVGELMCRGSKLLFAPAPAGKSKKERKKAGGADSAFIWDVSENRGWVINDPLQAYAPVSSSREFTNISPAVAQRSATPEKIDGHSCQTEQVTVMASDGTPTVFQVWRAPDLRGLPLRIDCPSTGAPLILTMSEARIESLPADLFQPPPSFTKYESSEAIMAELFLRKHNLNRKPVYTPTETEPGTGLNNRIPTRP